MDLSTSSKPSNINTDIQIDYSKPLLEKDINNTSHIDRNSIQVNKFLWDIKWLEGDEYKEIIENYQAYAQAYDFPIYQDTLPSWIYQTPDMHSMFFIENGLFTQINFPRIIDFKKVYKWKRMNFITDLPKKDPKVSYLVCTGEGSQSLPNSRKFRIHVICLYKDSRKNCPILILFHLLEVDLRETLDKKSCLRKGPKILKKPQIKPNSITMQKRVYKGIKHHNHNQNGIQSKKKYNQMKLKNKENLKPNTSFFPDEIDDIITTKKHHIIQCLNLTTNTSNNNNNNNGNNNNNNLDLLNTHHTNRNTIKLKILHNNSNTNNTNGDDDIKTTPNGNNNNTSHDDNKPYEHHSQPYQPYHCHCHHHHHHHQYLPVTMILQEKSKTSPFSLCLNDNEDDGETVNLENFKHEKKTNKKSMDLSMHANVIAESPNIRKTYFSEICYQNNYLQKGMDIYYDTFYNPMRYLQIKP